MKRKILSSVIGLLTGLANGFLGSGGGTVVVPCLEKFMKTTPHKAHATAIAVILPLSVISAFLYYYKLQIEIKTLMLVSLGGIGGGFTGAKILHKISAKYLHFIFGGIMIMAGVKSFLWH